MLPIIPPIISAIMATKVTWYGLKPPLDFFGVAPGVGLLSADFFLA